MELANANAIPPQDFAPQRPQDTIRAGFKGGRDYIVVEWLLDNGMMEQTQSYAFCTGRQTTNSYTLHGAGNQYDNKETDSDNKIYNLRNQRY